VQASARRRANSRRDSGRIGCPCRSSPGERRPSRREERSWEHRYDAACRARSVLWGRQRGCATASKGLEGETKPRKDRAFGNRQREQNATDSTAEQSLEGDARGGCPVRRGAGNGGSSSHGGSCGPTSGRQRPRRRGAAAAEEDPSRGVKVVAGKADFGSVYGPHGRCERGGGAGNAMNPRIGSGMQQAREPSGGENRRGGAIPRGRNMRRGWLPRRRSRAARRCGSGLRRPCR